MRSQQTCGRRDTLIGAVTLQELALVDHPHIAEVFDAGGTVAGCSTRTKDWSGAGTCLRLGAFMTFCACAWFGGIAWPAAGLSTPETNRCQICSGTFSNLTSYAVKDRVRQVKKLVCKACSELKTVCWACGVPAHPRTLRKLDDGRILCELDAKEAVLSETEARDLFADVKRELLSLLAFWPPRPETNFTVYLDNQDDFNRELRRKPVAGRAQYPLGLTRSEVIETNHYEHFIYLLSGMPRAGFRAVCAHVYTQAWLNEHSSKARRLHRDTEEGFCELMAWKYLTAQNCPTEAERIIGRTYTHGQVGTLVAAEKQFGFYQLVNWILHGVDSWLDKDAPASLLALNREGAGPEPAASLGWSKPVPTAVPATLVLKGITAGRFALINDQTLARNESGKVRIGTSNVVVKCLEIRDGSVLLQVEGSPQPTELFLPQAVR